MLVMFEIRLNGKYFDEVFYSKNMTADEVKKSLIDHDGYPSNIEVKRVVRGAE